MKPCLIYRAGFKPVRGALADATDKLLTEDWRSEVDDKLLILERFREQHEYQDEPGDTMRDLERRIEELERRVE